MLNPVCTTLTLALLLFGVASAPEEEPEDPAPLLRTPVQWAGPPATAGMNAPLVFLWPQLHVGGTNSCDFPFDASSSATFVRFDERGRAVYAWDFEIDFASPSYYAEFEVGPRVPATLFILGVRKNYTPGEAYITLAYQNLGVDSTKPFQLRGSIALNGDYDRIVVALQYGMTGAQAVEWFKDYRGHYAHGSDNGVARKEFAPLQGGDYRFYFEVQRLDRRLDDLDPDGRSPDDPSIDWEAYTVSLYDAEGWELASYEGRKTQFGFRTAETVSEVGRISVPRGSVPKYMRVSGPWYEPPIEP